MRQLKAVIYLRVSSDEQAHHGYSIAAQRAACSERARALGAAEVMELRDEGVSASLLDRPGLNALRAGAKRGDFRLVVIYDPDRFARNLSHQLLVTEEIERAGVRLEFVNFEWEHTAEGKLFYSLRGAVAEYEREKIRLRTMTGRLEKAREGKLPYPVAPLGYVYSPKTSQVEIDETEAWIVRRIFRDYLKGVGVNGIAWALTREGIPTRRGAPAWSQRVIHQTLNNTCYSGVYYANRKDMSGRHLNRFKRKGEKAPVRLRDPSEWIPVRVPPIVTPDEWAAVQERMAARREHWGRTRSRYLLSGLVRCGICGETMTGRRMHNWGQALPAYSCHKNAPGRRRGCGRYIRADGIEEAVWDHVVAWLQNPQALAKLLVPDRDTGSGSGSETGERYERELQSLLRKQREILGLLERDLVAGDAIVGALDRLRRREAAIRSSLDELREGSDPEGWEDVQGAKDPGELERILGENVTGMPLLERQMVVRQFVRGVTVGQDTLTIRAHLPENPGMAVEASGEAASPADPLSP